MEYARQHRNTCCELGGGGQGGGRPGEKGAGGVREEGEEGAGSGIPKVAGSGRKRGRLRNIVQYFAIEKNAKGREPKNTGREPGLKGTGRGRFKPPCPPPQLVKGVFLEKNPIYYFKPATFSKVKICDDLGLPSWRYCLPRRHRLFKKHFKPWVPGVSCIKPNTRRNC